MEGRVFEPGERVVLIDAESARRQRVAVIPVPGLEPLVGKLEPGQRILFRDGRQQFRVVDKARRTVYAECERCSEPVNAFNACTFPDSGLTFDPVGEPDREALSAFRKMGLTPDWVMVSLATRQEQIDQVREVVNGMWPEAGVRIMAKVELGEAVQRIDDILDASDGLLLGRGDLGLSIAPERLPTVQEQVAAKARAVDKPLLIATQMLEVFSATGTIYRAELSDIALAVRQGAAGVVLCAETSDSERPGQVIDLARRVIEMEGIRSPA
jgi:pyruvate kinase